MRRKNQERPTLSLWERRWGWNAFNVFNKITFASQASFEQREGTEIQVISSFFSCVLSSHLTFSAGERCCSRHSGGCCWPGIWGGGNWGETQRESIYGTWSFVNEEEGFIIVRKWTLHQNSSFQVWYSENSSSECNWDQLTVLILSVIMVGYYPMDPYCGCAHSWILYYNKSHWFQHIFHCDWCSTHTWHFPTNHILGHVLPLVKNVNSNISNVWAAEKPEADTRISCCR